MKVIQTIAWLFSHVCLFCLMRKMLYTCAALPIVSTWESFCVPADSPALRARSRATAWKVSCSEWKMIAQHCFHSNYRPTEMPHQHSSGTFSHAVQKEEGFIYRLHRDPFAFVRPAIHWGDPGERGRDSPSAVNTHTQKGRRSTPE